MTEETKAQAEARIAAMLTPETIREALAAARKALVDRVGDDAVATAALATELLAQLTEEGDVSEPQVVEQYLELHRLNHLKRCETCRTAAIAASGRRQDLQ